MIHLTPTQDTPKFSQIQNLSSEHWNWIYIRDDNLKEKKYSWVIIYNARKGSCPRQRDGSQDGVGLVFSDGKLFFLQPFFTDVTTFEGSMLILFSTCNSDKVKTQKTRWGCTRDGTQRVPLCTSLKGLQNTHIPPTRLPSVQKSKYLVCPMVQPSDLFHMISSAKKVLCQVSRQGCICLKLRVRYHFGISQLGLP